MKWTIRRRIHCIGIGGAGMAPLAELLCARGAHVTGSDRQDSRTTQRLREAGIEVQTGHEPQLVRDAQMVVYSSAVGVENPERAYAQHQGIPQYRRAEVLGQLMRHAFSVGVAGTHGKTTTTAMIGHLLSEAGLDPTVMVEMPGRSSNGLIGSEDLLVTEADEYDRSFLAMYPVVAVLTNVEADHLDCYGTIDRIKDAFIEFCSHVPFYGCVVACIDDPGVCEVIERTAATVVTCATGREADYRGSWQPLSGGGALVQVDGPDGVCGAFELKLMGEHNVRNALAAAVAAMRSGVPFESIAAAMPSFGGVRRRMEVVGEAQGVRVIDDYAHHPTEVRATLRAVRGMSAGRVFTVFQPHLYSRTRDFIDAFAESLMESDMVCVVDIYAAREEPIPGVSSSAIVERVRALGHGDAAHVASCADAVEMVAPRVQAGDVVILMGAGDIGASAQPMLERIAYGSTGRC
ncbi:MAG: UDP-N-acetylmuramate--L-alanine ligase [Chitinivibrionales bacterium]|nr:UDP-N-acetylmuramate--L-alanine ligase [Chitinivibrionales bacterium]